VLGEVEDVSELVLSEEGVCLVDPDEELDRLEELEDALVSEVESELEELVGRLDDG
jgi:hypothetical protein